MFTFLLQLADLYYLHTVGAFLVFYVMSWILHLGKLYQSSKYKTPILEAAYKSVSVIVPVVDEPEHIWKECLKRLKDACEGLDHEIVVVCNGAYSANNEMIARQMGFNVIVLSVADKRLAVAAGVGVSSKEIAVLLDSDTLVTKESIARLVANFQDPKLGGVMPRQEIFNRYNNVIRLVCGWLEDVRFFNTSPGLSYFNSVPCLIGRLFAIRMDALKSYMPKFTNQYFLGKRCLSGDDRVLTSYLLMDGYKTTYDDGALVYTNCPDTLSGFAKQRLRWSRSSFRETLLALPWIWKYPHMAFVMIGDVVIRWAFLYVLIRFALSLMGYLEVPHWIDGVYPMTIMTYVVIGIAGFFVSGYLKQLPQLIRRPQDFWFTPVMLLFITFVLTPVEWFGNLTIFKHEWMTRRVE